MPERCQTLSVRIVPAAQHLLWNSNSGGNFSRLDNQSLTGGWHSRDSAHKEPEFLDADMTPRDVIEALKRLRFQDSSCATIWIDKQIRDYLVTAVSALRQKKPHARAL